MMFMMSSSKSKKDYLLFASDRIVEGDGWIPGTMNVWSMPLPPPTDLYKGKTFKAPPLVQVTDFACWEQGRTIKDVRVDPGRASSAVVSIVPNLSSTTML